LALPQVKQIDASMLKVTVLFSQGDSY